MADAPKSASRSDGMKYLRCVCCNFLAVIPVRDDHSVLDCPFCKRVKCQHGGRFEQISEADFRRDAFRSERGSIREQMDAARYRWLRQCTGGEWSAMNDVRLHDGVQMLDAGIDAGIAKSGERPDSTKEKK